MLVEKGTPIDDLVDLARTTEAEPAQLDTASGTADRLNAATNDIRKGCTADTASAEQAYDALQRARSDVSILNDRLSLSMPGLSW